MDPYFEFLESTYATVIDACAQDESLNILKTIDNKSFYLSRVHQIFADIYCAERQNKIKALFQQNEKLRAKEVSFPSSETLIPKNYEREKERTTSRQSQAVLLKQNESLVKEIKQLKSDHIRQIQHLSLAHEAKIQNYQKEIEISSEKLRKLKEAYENLTQKCQKIENQLIRVTQELDGDRERQKIYEQRNKEYMMTISMLEEKNQKLNNENKIIKQTCQIYEGKIKHLIQADQRSKQKLKGYEKQFNKVATSLKDIPKYMNSLTSDHEEMKQYTISPILQTLQEKQNELIQSMQACTKLRNQLQEIDHQYTEYKIFTQRQLLEIKQKNRREVMNYEQTIRGLMQQNNVIRSQNKNEANVSVEEGEVNEKKIKELHEELAAKRQRVEFLEKTNEELLSQYEQLNELNKKEKKLIEKDRFKLQNKLQESKKLEKQLVNHIKMKNLEESGLENQYKSKIQQQIKTISQLQNTISNQEKSIINLKQRITSFSCIDQSTGSRLLEQQHQNELDILKMENRKLCLQIKELREEIKHKEKSISRHEQEIKKRDSQELEAKVSLKKMKQKDQKSSGIIHSLENSLKQERSKLSKMQEQHRLEISEIYEKHQKNTEQIGKQYERHYSVIISQNKTNSNSIEDERERKFSPTMKIVRELEDLLNNSNIEIEELKAKANEKQRTIEILQKAEADKQTDKSLLKEKIKELETIIENLENGKVQIIHYYESKISSYRNNFREFKYQFCQQTIAVMKELKRELQLIKEQVYIGMGFKEPSKKKRDLQVYQGKIGDFSQQIFKKLMEFHQRQMNKYLAQIKQLREHRIPLLQQQKVELESEHQNKLREKSLETMSIVAEKEYQINNLKQQRNVTLKKLKQVQNEYEILFNKQRKVVDELAEFKQIVRKMEQKVNQSEKDKSYYQKQLLFAQTLIQQLKADIIAIQNKHQQEIVKCRQKYAQENQRMFNRYQKEFGKMLKINEKTKEYMIQRIIPTKEETKVEKLKREIMQQKMKLQNMEKEQAKPTSYK